MISRLWERWNRINVAVARTALEAYSSNHAPWLVRAQYRPSLPGTL